MVMFGILMICGGALLCYLTSDGSHTGGFAAGIMIGMVGLVAFIRGIENRERAFDKRRHPNTTWATTPISSNGPQQAAMAQPPRGMVRCHSCGSIVRPQRSRGAIVFVLFLAGILPAFFYLLGARKRCPNCRAKL
jgi:hypothetical protein